MPARDLDLLIEAARAAGDIATGFFGRAHKRWEKADGAGPVTEADLAVNAMLERDLRAERPGYGWLSEETEDDPARLDRRRVFIVDPIDGTRSFAEGSRTWAHALAVVEDGIVTAGVVFLPMRDLLYAAAAGEGAWLNGVPIRASGRTGLDGAQVLAARPVRDARHWKSGQAPAAAWVYRPSVAYRMAVVAEGRFDAMLTFRPSWEWDVAAGDLILREAGAASTDRTGQALRFNNPLPQVNGLLAGGQAVHGALRAALLPAASAA